MHAMSARHWKWLLLTAFLVSHAVLAWQAAGRLSPVWDELIYPTAGVDLLKTGQVRFNADHPPLAKALLGAPLLFFRDIQPPAVAPQTDPYRLSFQFFHHNRVSAESMLRTVRAVSVMFSLLLAALVFWEVSRRWGTWSGFISLALMTVSPPIVARASLALLDLPLVFFMTLSLVAFARLGDSRRWWVIWIAAWSAALLTKSPALILAPVWIVMAWKRTSRVPVIVATAGVLVGTQILLACLGSDTLWTSLAMRGRDLAESRFPVFYMGRLWETAPWGSGLVAWVLKTPLSFICLLIPMGYLLRSRWQGERFLQLIGLVCAIALVFMIGVRSIIASGHYLFVYPLLAMAIGAAFSPSVLNRAIKGILLFVFLLMTGETLAVHPNHLAYMTPLVGGSLQGYRWLSDSDQDWGQGLPLLGAWLRREQIAQVLLAYSGSGDPRVYGIQYQDVFCPAVISGEYRGEVFPAWPGRMILAISSKVIQSEPGAFEWLMKNRRPQFSAGPTFLIFDLTQDGQARAWLADFYRQTGRPLHAQRISQ